MCHVTAKSISNLCVKKAGTSKSNFSHEPMMVPKESPVVPAIPGTSLGELAWHLVDYSQRGYLRIYQAPRSLAAAQLLRKLCI